MDDKGEKSKQDKFLEELIRRTNARPAPANLPGFEYYLNIHVDMNPPQRIITLSSNDKGLTELSQIMAWTRKPTIGRRFRILWNQVDFGGNVQYFQFDVIDEPVEEDERLAVWRQEDIMIRSLKTQPERVSLTTTLEGSLFINDLLTRLMEGHDSQYSFELDRNQEKITLSFALE
jgi:hypothetical protein